MASELERLREILGKHFDLSSLLEFTMECNPESLHQDYLKQVKSLGISRISLGVQSFQGSQLKRLERLATLSKIQESLNLIEKYFKNYSLDLMFGIPDQNEENLILDLEEIIRFSPPHVSIYLLTIADDHVWYRSDKMKKAIPTDEQSSRFYKLISDKLRENSYLHYEVSNFSKPGFQSLHNQSYWDSALSYMGFGPGAHGYQSESGHRYEMLRNLDAWLHHETGMGEIESLTQEQKDIEFLYLKLRSRNWVDKSLVNIAELSSLEAEGHIEEYEDQIRVNENSLILLDAVVQRLLC